MDQVLITAGAVLLTVVLAWAYYTAQRLNRLHIRTDSARIALHGALDRRAAVVAVQLPEAAQAATAAENCGLPPAGLKAREDAEREVQRVITGSAHPPGAAVADANARVSLAVRFYNEAVADTRALRLRPAVRALRLAGTAPMPEFFEFAAD